jgi:hypothetical protein
MRRCNPSRIFTINTYGRHGTSNNEQPQVTNAYSFLPPPPLLCQVYFILFIDVHLRQGEQISETVFLSNPIMGEGA